MIKVRSGVFETNSSSTHAICVSQGKIDMDDIDYKELVFHHGEFGWESDMLSSTEEKASYLYEALIAVGSDRGYSENGNDGEELKVKEYLDCISETLGKYNISCEFESDEQEEDEDSLWLKSYGIDHGYEADEFVDKCLSDDDFLLNYLFGYSFIITGNDNDEYFADQMQELAEHGDLDNLEVIYKDN